MSKNEIVKFKGNTLPSKDLGGFDKALERAAENMETSGGGLPYLKLDKDTGEWNYGQHDTDVEEGSHWAINPDTMEKGYVVWKGGKATKRMKNIRDGEVNLGELPNLGEEWKENVSFQLQCVLGEDEGTVVNYESSAYGARSEWKRIALALAKQYREDRAHIVPVVEMTSTSYMHTQWGKTFNPVFGIVKWIAYDGGDEQPAQPEASPDNKDPKKPAPAAAASAATNGAAPKRRVVNAPVTTIEEDEVETVKAPPAVAADPVQRRRRRAAAS